MVHHQPCQLRGSNIIKRIRRHGKTRSTHTSLQTASCGTYPRRSVAMNMGKLWQIRWFNLVYIFMDNSHIYIYIYIIHISGLNQVGEEWDIYIYIYIFMDNSWIYPNQTRRFFTSSINEIFSMGLITIGC